MTTVIITVSLDRLTQHGIKGTEVSSYNTVDRVMTSMVKEVHAAHILVKDEATAKKIKDEIVAGKNFGEEAKKYSTCPSKKKGGDLGWFHRGQMVKPFEDAAFAGKKGDLIGPIKTDFGWHIIKILEQR